MDVGALKNKIQNNTIPDFLIFSGQEWEVQKVYIKQIAKVKEQDVVRVDSITDIYTSLRNKSFLTKSYCYVVRDDKELSLMFVREMNPMIDGCCRIKVSNESLSDYGKEILLGQQNRKEKK